MNHRTMPIVVLFLLLAANVSCQPAAMPTPLPTIATTSIASSPAPTASPSPSRTAAPSATRTRPRAPTQKPSPSNTPAPPAGNAKNLELVGQIGGGITAAVAAAGHFAYLAIGPRLLVLDVTNPAQPVVAGQSDVLPDSIHSVAIVNGYAYVAAGEAGVFVIDVANPRQPTVVGSVAAIASAMQIVVADDYAYVAEMQGSQAGRLVNGGLRILHLTDPAHPTPIGFAEQSGGFFRIAIASHYAYAVGSGGLHIFDIGDPNHPAQVGVYPDAPDADDIALVDHYAFVLDVGVAKRFEHTLHIVDVSNPAEPVEVKALQEQQIGSPSRIVAVGHYLYLTPSPLAILDATNPLQPRQVGYYDTAGPSADIALSGDYAYLASHHGHSLTIVNVAHPEQPTAVGFFDVPKIVNDVAVVGQYAYIADGEGGLVTVDVSDPRAPVEVGASTRFLAWGLAIQGDYAYVAGDIGLRIVSIIDPLHPTEVGSVRIGTEGAFRVTVAGNRAYVTAGENGLYVIDVSNPTAPQVLGVSSRADSVAVDVAVVGRYAYVAGGRVFRVIDVSDSAHANEVGALQVTGWAHGVAVVGNYAHVAAMEAGLRIINIADPTHPVEIASFPTSDAFGVTVVGNLAYVADNTGGLRVVNIANPAQPTEAGYYKSIIGAQKAVVVGDKVYVASTVSGLVILQTKSANQGR